MVVGRKTRSEFCSCPRNRGRASFAPGFTFFLVDSGCAAFFGEPALHAAFKGPKKSPALLVCEGLFVDLGMIGGWRDGVGSHGSLLLLLGIVYAEEWTGWFIAFFAMSGEQRVSER